MKLAHIADIHIRLYKRHEEYRSVFSKLYQSLREHRVDRIILLGDIFHSKSILSPEAVDLAYEFFSNLSKIAPLDIVIGNHDVNVKNENRLDSITPIAEIIEPSCRLCKSDKINVYAESGFYPLGNGMQYGVFSLLDETHFPILNQPTEGKHLALFHGNLIGSVTENNYRFTDGQYDSAIMFKNYDAVLLGDIHKRQQIGTNGWYCGSLIQQDYGEGLEKGYMIWDTDNLLNPVFIPIPNDYAFYNLKSSYKVSDQNLPLISNPVSKPSVRLTLQNFDYTIAEIKQIETALKQTYKPISIEVRREVAPAVHSTQISKIKSTADVNAQNDLIRKFLDKTNKETVDRVIKINEEIRKQVSDDEILPSILWRVKELEWENTFSYGKDNIINFDKLKGLTGIFAPNRSGKSNFIDTILYNLFNKSARMSRITRIINNQTDECKSSAILEVNGEYYRVIRASKRAGDSSTSTRVSLEHRIDGKWINEIGNSRTDTDKVIRRMIGSFDDIVISNISPQGKISSFLEAGQEDTFRLELLSRFLGLNIFKIQYEIAKKQLNEFEALLKQFKQVDYATLIVNYRDEIEKLQDSLVDFEEDKSYLRNQSDLSRIQLATLRAMIQEVVDDTSSAEHDPEKLSVLRVQLKMQLDTEDLSLKKEESRVEKFEQTDFDQKIIDLEKQRKQKEDLQQEISKIEGDIRVAQLSLKKDRSKVQILDRQPWTDNLDVCQKCEFYHEADSLRKELQKFESILDALRKKKSEKDKEIFPILNCDLELQKIRDQKSEFDRLKNSIVRRQATVEKLSLQIQKVDLILQEQNREMKRIETLRQIKETNLQIDSMLTEKEKENTLIEKQLQSIDYSILSHNKRIVEVESLIRQNENSISKMSELETQYRDYELYLKAMHREGIPYSIIISYIDIINDEVHKLVGDYIPFGIKFSFDNDKRSIPINIVYENGTENPVELGSGMEKMISAIAIRAVLSSISNIPRCNLFIIDESFGALDRENIQAIDKLLDHLKTLFEHVILISHVPDVQDFVDQTITIDKTSGYSQIQFS